MTDRAPIDLALEACAEACGLAERLLGDLVMARRSLEEANDLIETLRRRLDGMNGNPDIHMVIDACKGEIPTKGPVPVGFYIEPATLKLRAVAAQEIPTYEGASLNVKSPGGGSVELHAHAVTVEALSFYVFAPDEYVDAIAFKAYHHFLAAIRDGRAVQV